MPTDAAKHKQSVQQAFDFLRKELDTEYKEAIKELDSAQTLMLRLGNKDVVIGQATQTPTKPKAAQPAKKKRPSRAKKPAAPAPANASPTPAAAA